MFSSGEPLRYRCGSISRGLGRIQGQRIVFGMIGSSRAGGRVQLFLWDVLKRAPRGWNVKLEGLAGQHHDCQPHVPAQET